VHVEFQHLAPGSYVLTISRTGFRRNDPQTAYLEMGSPAALTPSRRAKLQRLTRDIPEIRKPVRITGGTFTTTVPMRTNDVVLIQLERKP
jgi:xylan 1,4-beta-xylosidase